VVILDLYARLERRHWLDLARVPLLALLACIFFVLGASTGQAAGFRFTETTGRAVIMDSAMEQEARMLALEDALYLAALEGGARINGFSAVMADTTLEDHFVVRPASRILDYTITNEVIDGEHYEVSIRAAIGNLPRGACLHRRAVHMTIFKPRMTLAENIPAAAAPMAVDVLNNLVTTIERHGGVSANRATDVALDPSRLSRINDTYDYTALTKGVVRVRRGDFAVVPEIILTGQRAGNALSRRDDMTMLIRLHVLAGESYAPIDMFEVIHTVTTRQRSVSRSFNVIGQPRRPAIRDALIEPVAGFVDNMIADLQCRPLTATLAFSDGKLTVPVGSHHGIGQNALAVASGTDTPWQIMRVTKVDTMSSILTPLNDQRDPVTLAGRTVEFMENVE
jgi:hypothetical protein